MLGGAGETSRGEATNVKQFKLVAVNDQRTV